MIRHYTYKVVSNVTVGLAVTVLREAGFAMAFQRAGRGSIWLNRRFADTFADQDAFTCTTFDYNVSTISLSERARALGRNREA